MYGDDNRGIFATVRFGQRLVPHGLLRQQIATSVSFSVANEMHMMQQQSAVGSCGTCDGSACMLLVCACRNACSSSCFCSFSCCSCAVVVASCSSTALARAYTSSQTGFLYAAAAYRMLHSEAVIAYHTLCLCRNRL